MLICVLYNRLTDKFLSTLLDHSQVDADLLHKLRFKTFQVAGSDLSKSMATFYQTLSALPGEMGMGRGGSPLFFGGSLVRKSLRQPHVNPGKSKKKIPKQRSKKFPVIHLGKVPGAARPCRKAFLLVPLVTIKRQLINDDSNK